MRLWITPEAEKKLNTPVDGCHHNREDLIFVHKNRTAFVYCIRCNTNFDIVGISQVDFETFDPKGVWLMGSDIVFEPSEGVLKEALQGWIDETMSNNFVISEVGIVGGCVRVAMSLSVPEKNLARELLEEAVAAAGPPTPDA